MFLDSADLDDKPGSPQVQLNWAVFAFNMHT